MGMYLIKPISAGCQPTSLLLVHTWFPITFVRQLWAGTAWKVVFTAEKKIFSKTLGQILTESSNFNKCFVPTSYNNNSRN